MRAIQMLWALLSSAQLFISPVLADTNFTGALRLELDLGSTLPDSLSLNGVRELAFGSDGTAFVLEDHNDQIRTFSSSWEPGNWFYNPTAGPEQWPGDLYHFFMHRGEVWVYGRRRAVVYSEAGEFLCEDILPPETGRYVSAGGRTAAYCWSCPTVGTFINDDLKLTEPAGPLKPDVEELKGMVKASSWLPLVGEDDKLWWLYGFDGIVFDNVGRHIDLGLGRGQPNGSPRYQEVVVDACAWPGRGFLVLRYERFSIRPVVVGFDHDWKRIELFDTPPEAFRPIRIRVSPAGDVCLFGWRGNTIRIYNID